MKKCTADFKEIGSSFEAAQFTSSIQNSIYGLDNCYYLRCARECLFVVGQHHSNIHKRKTVLMPNICCASMVQPFYQLGFEVFYYNINECFSVDEDNLLELLKKDSLLLVMDYFGIPSCSNSFLKKIKKEYSLSIVKDFTHSYSCFAKDNSTLDYKIISLRKWLPIPDGAVLVSKMKLNIELNKDNDFATVFYTAMKNKAAYLITNDMRLKNDYLAMFKTCSDRLKETIVPTSISEISEDILRKIDIDSVFKKRKRNYIYLYKQLSKDKNIERIVFKPQESPFCLPILVCEKRDELQKYLSERGVYCQVLWPLPIQCEPSGFNKWFSDHMLSIPCDQRYTPKDLSRIAPLISDFYLER